MQRETAESKGKIWLKRETKPYTFSILFLTFLTLFSTFFSLGFAYIVRYLINSASDGQASRLWIFSGCVLGLLLLKIVFKTWSDYAAEKLRTKMFSSLRTKTFSSVLRSDYACVSGYHSGELMNRLNNDVAEVTGVTVGFLPALTGMLAQTFGAVIALLTIDPWFTLLYVLCGAAFCGLYALFRKQIKKRHKEMLESDGAVRSFMQEGLASLMTLKAYGAEEKYTDESRVLSKKYETKRTARNRLRSGMNGVFTTLSNFGLIFAVVWCSVRVLWGETDDYGSILSVILLLMQFQQPLSGFSSLAPAYYARLSSGERLAELESFPKEMPVTEKNLADYAALQAVAIEDLSFTYGREEVLQGVNVAFRKGETVCLTGSSGSGKSTLFKLLLNVFHSTNGRILLQTEQESRVLTAADRGLFAYVPQGNFLFSGTIRGNLTLFSGGNIDETKLNDALRVACAEFVFDLPDGLETQLQEKGAGLSEGQLQRLAVTRALLSDRPFLLLDEATSALDGETESALLENLKGLRDKTCLIITHRPAALSLADKVYALENGKLTERK